MKSRFGTCIENLRKENGYTQQYVIDNAVNENGCCVISSLSAYRKIIAGERNSPRNFDEILAALARLYGVTTDFLLGLEDEPRHVKAVNETTGLSGEAVRSLMRYAENKPEIIKMLDALISSPGILESIFKQSFDDYVECEYGSGILDSKEHDELLKRLYSALLKTISENLANDFDRMHESSLSTIAETDGLVNLPVDGRYLSENGKENADKFISQVNEPVFHSMSKKKN